MTIEDKTRHMAQKKVRVTKEIAGVQAVTRCSVAAAALRLLTVVDISGLGNSQRQAGPK